MKKIITMFLSMIMLVGCSKVAKVKTIEEYKNVYLKDAESVESYDYSLTSYFGGLTTSEVVHSSNGTYDLIPTNGGYDESYLEIYSNEDGTIDEIELCVSAPNTTSSQYEYHLEGLLKYLDSINTSKSKEEKYSDIIRESISYVVNSGFNYDSDDILIDNDDVYVALGVYPGYFNEYGEYYLYIDVK